MTRNIRTRVVMRLVRQAKHKQIVAQSRLARDVVVASETIQAQDGNGEYTIKHRLYELLGFMRNGC